MTNKNNVKHKKNEKESNKNLIEIFNVIAQRSIVLRSLGIHINFVPPVIANGKKVWALGNKVYVREQIHETFHDFLIFILAEKLGSQWMAEQQSFKESDRHYVYFCFEKYMEWRDSLIKKSSLLPTQKWEGVPNGWTKHLFCLAFDVASLEHTSDIPETLLKRLRNKKEYQGARYEIAIAAIFARLGFSIKWIDPRVDRLKHCEFIAVSATGSSIAVEAKSRHKNGVIHEPGESDHENNSRGNKIKQLINKARLKSEYGKMPFMIFIDVNAHMGPAKKWTEIPWVKDILLLARRSTPITAQDPDLCTATYFTNFSFHYHEGRESNFQEHLSAIPQYTRFSPDDPHIFANLQLALKNYGHIPNIDLET
jgi:hypothetical protein